MNKAFFIDKDGTLTNYNVYSNPALAKEVLEDEIIFDQIVDGLKHIQKKGYKLIIISNQPWISRGVVNYDDMEKLFQNLIKVLGNHGVKIDDYFYCPHQTLDNCECKKPKPKMILDAAKKYKINLKESYFVGDMDLDILAGQNAGTKTILVLTGCGNEFKNIVNPTYILKNLNHIKEII
tara:strand:+ start:6317 stop:6853 length:537 start_codon:yes stop_codon:yes gene_type:complete